MHLFPTFAYRCSVKRRLLAHVLRYRRELSAGCAGLAVLLTINSFRPSHDELVSVVTARHTISAGTQITDQDVVESHIATSNLWPELLMDKSLVLGHTTSHALVAHQFIGRNDLVGANSLTGLGTNVVAVQIPWSGGMDFIQPGLHIDVYANQSDAAALVADDARVISVPAHAQGGLFSTSNTDKEFLMLALTSEQARDVASQPQGTTFTVAVRSQ